MTRSGISWLASTIASGTLATFAIFASIFSGEINAFLKHYTGELDWVHWSLVALFFLEAAFTFCLMYVATRRLELARNEKALQASEYQAEIDKQIEELRKTTDDLNDKNKEDREARDKEIIALRNRNSDLLRQLQTDTKSGLSSYDFLKRKFDDEYVPDAKKGIAFSVLMIDIVDFKKINNNLGHDAGNEAISLVGGFLKSFVRGNRDLAARYGEAADEFFFVIAGNISALTGFTTRLRLELRRDCTETLELFKANEIVVQFWSSGTDVSPTDNWATVEKRLINGLVKAKTISPDTTVITKST